MNRFLLIGLVTCCMGDGSKLATRTHEVPQKQPGTSLRPSYMEVQVKEGTYFTFVPGDRLPDKYMKRIEEEEESYDHVLKSIAASDFTWFVNNVPGGNSTYGTITQDPHYPLMVRYDAPSTLPDVNPVPIEARLNGSTYFKRDSVLPYLKETASVLIADDYQFTFVGYSSMGVLHMIDSSSCKIRILGKQVKLLGIQNYPPWSDWPASAGGCTYTYPDKGAWKGLVEIAGMASGSVSTSGKSTANNSGAALTNHISISLVPAIGNTPTVLSKCPGYTVPIPSRSQPAQPRTIEFEVQGKDITVFYGGESAKHEIRHVVNGQGFVIRVDH